MLDLMRGALGNHRFLNELVATNDLQIGEPFASSTYSYVFPADVTYSYQLNINLILQQLYYNGVKVCMYVFQQSFILHYASIIL
jgi:hypothetical protein